MLDRPRGARARDAIPVALFAASVLGLVALVLVARHTYWQQTDAIVYRDAGRSLWEHPDQLYRRDFSAARLPFTYPPFAALVFAAAAGFRFAVWQLGLAVLGVAGLLVSCWSALRVAGTCSAWRKALVLSAVCLWLEPVDMTLFFGQINLVLMALVLTDFALPAGSRWKGVGVGVAAGVKLTPLIFLAHLMLTGRWRAARTGLATSLATVLVGLAVLPASSRRYWATTVSRAGDDPTRLVNQSLNGMVRRAVHAAAPDHAIWLLAAGVVLAAGLLIARSAAASGRELAGVCAAAVTGLLVSPISWTHHYVYVAPVLALAFSNELSVRARRGLAGVAIAVFGWWPLAGGPNGLDRKITFHPSGLLRLVAHNGGRELRWCAWQFLLGNGYVWAALLFLLFVVRAARGPAPAAGA